jgi:hypothetical protein
MEPAAQLWCREQMLRQHPQWQLQEQFLPSSRHHAMLLMHGVLSAILQIPLTATPGEVSGHKLGWWVDALQQLLQSSAQTQPDATAALTDHASLQHPALKCLHSSRHMTFFRAIPLTDWLHDLQRAAEPSALADVAELRQWCWRLARPLDWLDAWLTDESHFQAMLAAPDATDRNSPEVASVHSRRLMLQQINTLPQRNLLYHAMPMTLKARHQLQMDTLSQSQHAPAERQAEQPWPCPGELLADLLAVDAELNANIPMNTQAMPGALQQQSRFWQAGNRALAHSLRKRVKSSHAQPCVGIGGGLLWSCWRIALAIRRQTP